MHELALARTLVDEILQVVERERLRQVSRVVLELGTAAGVEADALSLGFEVAARSSPVEGAALEIEPLDEDALGSLSGLLEADGRDDQMVQLLTRSLALLPTSSTPWSLR